MHRRLQRISYSSLLSFVYSSSSLDILFRESHAVLPDLTTKNLFSRVTNLVFFHLKREWNFSFCRQQLSIDCPSLSSSLVPVKVKHWSDCLSSSCFLHLSSTCTCSSFLGKLTKEITMLSFKKRTKEKEEKNQVKKQVKLSHVRHKSCRV